MGTSSSKKEMKVCTGLNCSKNHSAVIINHAKKHEDVDLSTSCCMGLCSLAPNVMLGGKVISRVNPNDVNKMLGKEAASGFSDPPTLDDNGLEDVSDLLDV